MDKPPRIADPQVAEKQSDPPVTRTHDWEVSVPTTWHLKGKNPAMRMITKEQVETLLSAGNPWPLAMLTFTGGITAALLIQLKAGVVDVGSKDLLWSIFYPMLVLTIYCAIAAIRDFIKTKRLKQAIVADFASLESEATQEVKSK